MSTTDPDGNVPVWEPQWLPEAMPSSAVPEAGPEHLPGPPRHPRRFGPGRLLIAVLVLVLAAGGGAWLLNRTHPLRVTVSGATVDHSAQPLQVAQQQLATLVAHRHGATNSTTRCYYNRTGGQAKTDVDRQIFCGPVLFFNGTTSQDYLPYDVSPRAESNGHVTLAVDAQIASEPAALPAGARLERPDGRTPPYGSGDLRVPIPPPATPDVLTRISSNDVYQATTMSLDAVAGSKSLTVTVEEHGTITHYGHDDSERSTPRGSRLIAFYLLISEGEDTVVAAKDARIGVSVDGATARPLPLSLIASGVAQWFVAAIPASATSFDLVLVDAGTTQRISLLTGRPAPSNVAVLRRTNRYAAVSGTGHPTAAVNAYGQQFTAHLTVKVDGAWLEYFVPGSTVHPSSPHNAFVLVRLCYSSPNFVDSTTCFGFRGTDLTLTAPGGHPITGRNIGTDRRPIVVFEVPATFTTGKLKVSGPESSGDGWSLNVTSPYSVPITFAD